jgi:hypothetical protein
MIRIAITAVANAICSILPEDALLSPVQHPGGDCLIHIEAAERARPWWRRRAGG